MEIRQRVEGIQRMLLRSVQPGEQRCVAMHNARRALNGRAAICPRWLWGGRCLRKRGRLMWIVRLALRRPYTFVVVSLLIAVLGLLSIVSMPMDIFPAINIPVISVIWSYGGLSATEMQESITTVVERANT